MFSQFEKSNLKNTEVFADEPSFCPFQKAKTFTLCFNKRFVMNYYQTPENV
jgi:hypothetical protein